MGARTGSESSELDTFSLWEGGGGGGSSMIKCYFWIGMTLPDDHRMTRWLYVNDTPLDQQVATTDWPPTASPHLIHGAVPVGTGRGEEECTNCGQREYVKLRSC